MSSMRQKKPRPGMKASSLAHGRPPQPPRVVVDLWGTAPSPVPNDMPRAGHQRSRQKPTVDDKISQSSSELPAGIMPQIGWGLGPDRNRATTDSATSFNAVGFVPKRDVSSNSNGASPSSISEPNGTKVGESADTSGEDADDNTEAPSMIDPFDDGISAMHEPHSSSATTASADHSFSVFPTEGGVWDQPVLSSQSLATGAGESGEDMSRLTSASWNATFSQPQYSPALGGGLQQQTSMPMKMAPSPRPPPVLADESGWCVAEILAQARPGTRTSSECNEVKFLLNKASWKVSRIFISKLVLFFCHFRFFANLPSSILRNIRIFGTRIIPKGGLAHSRFAWLVPGCFLHCATRTTCPAPLAAPRECISCGFRLSCECWRSRDWRRVHATIKPSALSRGSLSRRRRCRWVLHVFSAYRS